MSYVAQPNEKKKRRLSISVATTFMAAPISAAVFSRMGEDHTGKENTKIAMAMRLTMLNMI